MSVATMPTSPMHPLRVRSSNAGWRRWKNRIATGVMGLLLVVCLVPLASLLWTLMSRGAGEITFTFLSKPWAPVGETGGVAQAILGSIELLGMASLIAVPVGLANGLYLARRVPGRLASVTRLLLDVMTGIPAIVVGVFIYMLVVRSEGFSLQIGFSAIAGSLALAMIMLPIFARASEDALRSVPPRVQESALALGLSARRVTLRIIVRAAATGILTALFSRSPASPVKPLRCCSPPSAATTGQARRCSRSHRFHSFCLTTRASRLKNSCVRRGAQPSCSSRWCCSFALRPTCIPGGDTPIEVPYDDGRSLYWKPR